MATYSIKAISNRLYLVVWDGVPKFDEDTGENYLEAIRSIIEGADEPIYFISDLRRGRIASSVTLTKLARILDHPNFGGGTSFSKNPAADIAVSLFRMRALRNRASTGEESPEIYEKPEDALAYIESLEPGITQGIRWNDILASTHRQ